MCTNCINLFICKNVRLAQVSALIVRFNGLIIKSALCINLSEHIVACRITHIAGNIFLCQLFGLLCFSNLIIAACCRQKIILVIAVYIIDFLKAAFGFFVFIFTDKVLTIQIKNLRVFLIIIIKLFNICSGCINLICRKKSLNIALFQIFIFRRNFHCIKNSFKSFFRFFTFFKSFCKSC